MKARKLIPFIALALLLVMGCKEKGRVSPLDVETQQGVREVSISIDADRRVLLDGKVVALEDLEGKLIEKLADEKAEFVITLAPQTPMGLVFDVQQQLPARNVAGIRYPEPRG